MFLRIPVLAAAILAVVNCAFAAISTLPLRDAANASRIDQIAGDGQGGWIDEGANDLRVLSDGKAKFGGVDFEIAPCADETTPAAIVLDAHRRQAVIRLEQPKKAKRLYLLHAVSGSVERKAKVGMVRATYADGSKSEFPIINEYDVSDWTSSSHPVRGARAWSVYNGVTQVSLFVSSFELKDGEELSEVALLAEDIGRARWMTLAVSCGDKVRVKRLESKLTLERKYDALPLLNRELKRFPAGAKPKNVILLIGDGMGRGCQRLTSMYLYGHDDLLTFQQFPFAGFCTTQSANSDATDSSAAGTAIATGYKTNNGTLGMRPDPATGKMVPAPSVAERAHAQGFGVGILSNDHTHGATPGAFYAHVPNRGMKDEVIRAAKDSGYEFAIGYGGEDKPAEIDGVQVVAEKVMSVRLAQALSALADRKRGFFVMAESATPDHGNHGNDPARSVLGVVQVDWMARTALEFAEKRGDTLVIVTADHETGGVNAIRSPGPDGKITVHYSVSSHTGNPVPLYAYGPGAELFEGMHDNTEIAKLVSVLMGIE